MQAHDLEPTLTVPQAAAYLNIGLTKTKALVKSGAIKSYKNGKLRRIKREWLLEFERHLVESTAHLFSIDQSNVI